MSTPRMRTIHEVYGEDFAEEEEFERALGVSLSPRGFGLLFDLVTGLGLPAGSVALDVGCREAYHCLELARRYGFTVHGVEPVRRHLDNAAAALAAAEPEVAARVRVDEGVAEHLAEPDASVDLIWCRDVLEHVADLGAVFREFRRVLRPGGHCVIYHMTATEWLTEAEAARMWPQGGIYASSVDPANFEAAIAAGGLVVERRIELSGEWREWAEEKGMGLTSRQLLGGAYQMIGKLNPRIYALTSPIS